MEEINMAREKRSKHSKELAKLILEEYQPKSLEDMDNALKDIFGPMIEGMLKGEMDHHLGYKSNDKGSKENDNRRNGYGKKTLKTTKGEVTIDIPRDRDASFDPELIKKHQRDISAIEGKVIAMYARGMSQRDISKTIEDIYGFGVSHEMISDITDRLLPEIDEWRDRPLKKCYPFIFVDCMYVTLRDNYDAKECAVYAILGYDLNGYKDILGIWLSESESKNYWMQIFDEIKKRGVEDIFFISMDGVSGLEDGAKAIFPKVIVQRCIVHLIRNSLRYVPSKEYKNFTSDIKKIYSANSLNAAHNAFDLFLKKWDRYTGAIDVWKNNFKHIEQLFDYGSSIRKIMYTTNAIESVNHSFRKLTKKGAFPNENAIYKVLYLRIKELKDKWSKHPIQNWSMVLNQLMVNDLFKDRIIRYTKI